MQFSVQKMLLGNSVDEVEESDFEQVVERLQVCLKRRTIRITDQSIRDATVITIHPAKNIVIGGGYRAPFVIAELAKIDLMEKMEMDRKQYKNNGHALQYHSKSHAFAIYDKIAEDKILSVGRAVEKDRLPLQLSLFRDTSIKRTLPEIVRFEVRLVNKNKMSAVLVKLGFEANPSFRAIFRRDLWRKVVQMYWNYFVIEKNAFLYDAASGPQATLKKIIRSNGAITPKEAIYQVGLATLSRDQDGIRGLRKEIATICDQQTWYRIASSLKQLNSLQQRSDCHSWVMDIENQINIFESYKLPRFDV